MKRGKPLIRRAPPQRQATQSTYTPRPRQVVGEGVLWRTVGDSCRLLAQPLAPMPMPKTPRGRAGAIRNSARGEECTVRIIGACSHDPDKTIWSHAPLQAAGKGRSMKAIELAGAFCCTSCDAVVDGQAPLPAGATRESVLLDWFMGHMRSLVRLAQKGVL